MLDVLRVLKGGKSLADSLATHPDYFSDLYINMVRAGEASGALAAIFERLAEFERSRDDLRNYIISSMIYPALLALVGLASILLLLTFVVPRFASIFAGSTHEDPGADADHAGGQRDRADLLVDGGRRRSRPALVIWRELHADPGGPDLVGRRCG